MKARRKAARAEPFPVCRALIGPRAWPRLLKACGGMRSPESLPDRLAAMKDSSGAPDFLAELARLEWARHEVSKAATPAANETDRFEVNPTLNLLPLSWRLCGLVNPAEGLTPASPRAGAEHAMVWRDPVTGGTRVQAAEDAELLALKVVVEEIPIAKAAQAAKAAVPVVENALWRAAEKGILLPPRSRIRRDPALFPIPAETPAAFTSSPAFLLQWHITQACDLRCKHCYDRSKRSPLTLEQGVKVLDDLRRFCADRRVRRPRLLHRRKPVPVPGLRGALARGGGTRVPALHPGQPGPAPGARKAARHRAPAVLPGQPGRAAGVQRPDPRRGAFRAHDRVFRRAARPGDRIHRDAHGRPRQPGAGAAAGRAAPRTHWAFQLQPPLAGRRRRRAGDAVALGLRRFP